MFGQITLELKKGSDFQVALHACQAPKQFWRQTKCCSAKFSSFVGTWGFVIAFPVRYRSSPFVLKWNFLMHDDHNFSLLLLKHFLIKCCLSIISLHVNLHNWHISLSSLRWNGLNGYFKYSHPEFFSPFLKELWEVPLIKEWLKSLDQQIKFISLRFWYGHLKMTYHVLPIFHLIMDC